MSQKSSVPPTRVPAEKLVRDIRRAIWGAMNSPAKTQAAAGIVCR